MPTVWRRVRRSSFEILILVACILSGATGLVHPERTSPVIARVLPHWELYVWYGGLLGGGVVALVGLLARRPASVAVERSGMVALAALCTCYGVAVITQVGMVGVVPSLFVGLSGVACALHAADLSREVRRVVAVEAQLRADLLTPKEDA